MSAVLYDLAVFQNGRGFRSTETRGNGGLPIVKIAEMNRGISPNTGWYDGDYENRHLIKAGDLLFAWSGTIVIQRWQGPTALLNQHIFRVTAKPGVDQNYLRYLLKSLQPRFEAIVADQRTTMGHVKVADLKATRVNLPPLAVQEATAAVLGALDAKIDSNSRLTSAILSLIRAGVMSALTPAPMRVPVLNLASFTNGGAYTKGASGSGRMVVRIAELNAGPGASTIYSDMDVPGDKVARAGDILMSWSGSLGVYRWFRDEAIVNQHIFKVLPMAEHPAWLVFDRLDSVMPVFRRIAKDKATTMGHIQRGHLESTMVDIPAPDAVAELSLAFVPLWDRLLLAERENIRLSQLRDALMPELMSGRMAASKDGPAEEVAA